MILLPRLFFASVIAFVIALVFSSVGSASEKSACAASATSPACRSELDLECAKQKRYLLESSRRRVSFEEVLDRAIDSKKRVVIFGESHGERSSKFFTWALARFKEKRPDLDCVLVEQPQKTYETALEACNVRPDCNRKKTPLFSAVREALDLGFKVHAVDAVPDLSAKNFLADVDRRNGHMSDRTAALLASSCHGAIVVVGALHAHLDSRLRSVPQRLQARGLPSYRIELVAPGFTNFGSLDPRWIWTDAANRPVCKEIPGPLGENFGFYTSPHGKIVRSLYAAISDPGTEQREFSGHWEDYDAALLLGCEDPSAKTCDPYRAADWTFPNKTYLTAPK